MTGFTCPVCGKEFEHLDQADRHYDHHSPREYLTTWEEDVDREDCDDVLDWLCWCRAHEGERFYPPEETAEECMEAHAETYEENDDMEYERGLMWERGQHGRAWSDAVDFFVDLQTKGFDPVGRAKRHIEEARDDGLDLPDIEWEWLRRSHYDWDYERHNT